jgi:hypothetical protein
MEYMHAKFILKHNFDIILPVEMMNCCQAAKRLRGYVVL